MSKIRWINKGQQISTINIAAVEKKYEAQFICDLAVTNSAEPIPVFWRPNNYFGIWIDMAGSINICSASSVAEGTWNASEAASGEIIFSRFRHDFRMSKDKTAMADGGRDYFKYKGKPVIIRISGSDFIIDE